MIDIKIPTVCLNNKDKVFKFKPSELSRLCKSGIKIAINRGCIISILESDSYNSTCVLTNTPVMGISSSDEKSIISTMKKLENSELNHAINTVSNI